MKFKLGDKVRIVARDYEPDLKLGEVVTIYSVACEEQGYYVEKEDDVFWVEGCDVEAVVDHKKMKGWELLKEIAEENIKEGTKFKDSLGNAIYFDGINLRYENGEGKYYSEDNDDINIATINFEIIEEQEDINIQDIEETKIETEEDGIEYFMTEDMDRITFREDIETRKIINELIKAIKQLDKEIKK